MTTETPRTDEVAFIATENGGLPRAVVPTEFARQLEEELAHMTDCYESQREGHRRALEERNALRSQSAPTERAQSEPMPPAEQRGPSGIELRGRPSQEGTSTQAPHAQTGGRVEASATSSAASSTEYPKHLQDAPRTLRATFKVADPNDPRKTVNVVYASFAVCMEREANSLRSQSAEPLPVTPFELKLLASGWVMEIAGTHREDRALFDAAKAFAKTDHPEDETEVADILRRILIPEARRSPPAGALEGGRALDAPRDATPGSAVPGRAATPSARDIDIAKLVDRFLAWPVPDSVCSDPCATIQNYGIAQGWPKRSGTNFFNAVEAKAMLEFVLQGITLPSSTREQELADAKDDVKRLHADKMDFLDRLLTCRLRCGYIINHCRDHAQAKGEAEEMLRVIEGISKTRLAPSAIEEHKK